MIQYVQEIQCSKMSSMDKQVSHRSITLVKKLLEGDICWMRESQISSMAVHVPLPVSKGTDLH